MSEETPASRPLYSRLQELKSPVELALDVRWARTGSAGC